MPVRLDNSFKWPTWCWCNCKHSSCRDLWT